MAVPATMTLLPKDDVLVYTCPTKTRKGTLFTGFRTNVNVFGTNASINFDVFIWEPSA